MKLFSKKDSDNRENLKKVLPDVVGAGALAYAFKDNSLIKQHANDLINSKITAEDSKKIRDSLLKKAKDQGIGIINDPYFGNSVYTNSGKHANFQRKLSKALKRRHPKLYKMLGGEALPDSILDNLGKDKVVLGNGTLADVDILSHELGHAQYLKSGRSKNLVAKAAHKLFPISNMAMSPIGSAGAFAIGARSGYKTEKKKSEGRKASFWEKAAPVAVPIATAPLLIAEGAASLKGLKMMKEAGASKELLKQSKRRLGDAWGTYAAGSLKPLFASGAGVMSGRALAKVRNNKSNDDHSGEKTYSELNREKLRIFTRLAGDRTPLSEYKSSEGILRTIAADSIIGQGSNYYGRKAGLKAAEIADMEGDTDLDIIRKAGKAGMKRGALIGAATNAGLGAALGAGLGYLVKRNIIKKAIGGLLIGGATGALVGGIGGRNSARVLVKDKIRQRNENSNKHNRR